MTVKHRTGHQTGGNLASSANLHNALQHRPRCPPVHRRCIRRSVPRWGRCTCPVRIHHVGNGCSDEFYCALNNSHSKSVGVAGTGCPTGSTYYALNSELAILMQLMIGSPARSQTQKPPLLLPSASSSQRPALALRLAKTVGLALSPSELCEW